MKRPRIRVVPAKEAKGPAWAKRYPNKANEPWLIANSGGKRIRERVGDDTPEGWAEARRQADELRRELEREADPTRGLGGPTLSEVMDDYEKRGLRHHAQNTKATRRQQFAHLKPALGRIRLDRLKVTDLTKWWTDHVVVTDRSPRTADGHLEALSAAIEFARLRGAEVANPVADAKARLKAQRRTKAERGRDEKNKRPLMPDQALTFAAALDDARPDVRLMGLLLLDAGLRLGEAEALRWEACHFGEDGNDPSRHLLIREGADGTTKSGRSRKVGMSRRLRRALLEFRMLRGRARADVRVLPRRNRDTWRKQLREVLPDAGISRDLRPKDLRDTYASILLTLGIQLPWISQQLGHHSMSVTEKHYAQWVSRDYQPAIPLEPGEVPADLLARCATKASPSATKAENSNGNS